MSDFDNLIPTRRSLLNRLKDLDDQESWKQFFDLYWRLIYTSARNAGLDEGEAEDVVQETISSISKSMPNFNYNPAKGSFKRYLLKLTRWRIRDQLRKRPCALRRRGYPVKSSDRTPTETVEKMADPAGVELEKRWDEEWEKNLLETAIARVKRKVDPKNYQAFDLCVFKNWPTWRVARNLKMNRARIYLTRHKITKLIKKEVALLRARAV